MYCEMYVTPHLFVLFLFGLHATLAGETLQGHDDVGGKA